MKICIFDMVGSHKTTKEIKEHFENQGHEVRHTIYWNDDWVKWSNVSIFEYTENNIVQASKRGHYPDTKIITRCVDIEAWCGQYRGVNWDNVDDLVFMSEHIRDMVCDEMDFKTKWPHLSIRTISLGVDVSKWTFSDKHSNDGRKIAMVCHRWTAKGLNLAIQVLAELIRVTNDNTWELHICGSRSSEKWYHAYLDYIVKQMGLQNNVIIYEGQSDTKTIKNMDEWLDDKDYALTCSMKDSYSLVVGEALAKGIKTMCHNFMGAKNIWDSKYVWSSINECVQMFLRDYNPHEYRKYIEDNHKIENVLKMWDKLIAEPIRKKHE